MKFVPILILILLLLIGLIYVKRERTEVTMVRSTVDGEQYAVQNKPDKQNAADTLARIKRNMMILMDHCVTNIKDDKRVERLKLKFDPSAIAEGTDDARYTTYTLNKGEKMVFCLRTRDINDNVHDVNLLTFVAVHEMAHVMTLSEGHTEEFNKNFKFLITEAVKTGIYKPVNYRVHPQKYCGIDVTDTPLGNESFN